MIITILKTIAAFIILMLIGTNLLGMIVRTLLIIVSNKKTESNVLNKINKENKISSIILLAFVITATIGYFYILNHYFNYILSVAAGLLMISRFPDLITEIKTGKKISKTNMPNRQIDIIFNLITWLALPIVWYSFYYNT